MIFWLHFKVKKNMRLLVNEKLFLSRAVVLKIETNKHDIVLVSDGLMDENLAEA